MKIYTIIADWCGIMPVKITNIGKKTEIVSDKRGALFPGHWAVNRKINLEMEEN